MKLTCNASAATSISRRAFVSGAAGIWFATLTRSQNNAPILRRGSQADPESLDIHRASGAMESRILGDLFEGLTTTTAEDAIGPGIAESWVIDPDGLRYEFRLRRNAQWSNGDPVTSADFQFGLQRLLTPATGAPYASLFYGIQGAEAFTRGQSTNTEALGVHCPDPRTLIIELDRPVPYLLDLLRRFPAYPIHRPSYLQHGEAWTRPGNLVSNGAFELTEWRIHDIIRLTRNVHFYDAHSVSLAGVTYVPTEDRQQELRRYRVGEVDTTEDVPADQVSWLRHHYAEELIISPRLATQYFLFNMHDRGISDVRVRQALYMALDRDILTTKLMSAGEQPAYSIVPPATPNCAKPHLPALSMTQEQRFARARQLLMDAGVSPSRPLRLEIAYFTSADQKKIALAAAVMWEPLGVEISLRNVEQKVFIAMLNQRDFQLALTGWTADYEDPATFLEPFDSNAGELNQPGYVSQRFDAMLAKGRQTVNLSERAAVLADAETLLIADAPIVPIYFSVSRSLIKPYVHGWYRHAKVQPKSRYLSLA